MNLAEITTGIQHIGVPTNNIEKTIEFYKSLGFEVALTTVNEAAGEQVAFLRLKNLVIETYQNGQAAGKPGAIDHIALNVTDIQTAFDIIRSGEYNMLNETIQFLPFWKNGVKFFTILGPNGEKVEFSQML
jgi:catechol 2,3-dioxygenase-like lactoylglutathione lyase family enzyme